MTLKLIENELIPIFQNKEDDHLVNARDLHAFLEVGRDYSTWIHDRLFNQGFAENQDYVRFSPKPGKTPKGGRPSVEYALTLNTAMHIALMERNEKGQQVRQYFIDFEKRAREALRKQLDLVARYVLPECREWVKTFPDEFFQEVYRLHGWTWGDYKHTHPSCVGNIINKYVYGLLPEGVFERIKELNSRLETGWLKNKNHQFLSNEAGVKHLEMHLHQLIGIMQTCVNWDEFEARMIRKLQGPSAPRQLQWLVLT